MLLLSWYSMRTTAYIWQATCMMVAEVKERRPHPQREKTSAWAVGFRLLES